MEAAQSAIFQLCPSLLISQNVLFPVGFLIIYLCLTLQINVSQLAQRVENTVNLIVRLSSHTCIRYVLMHMIHNFQRRRE